MAVYTDCTWQVVEKRNRFLSTLLNEDLRITETLLEQHFVKRMATYDLEAFAESMQHPLWGWNPDRVPRIQAHFTHLKISCL